MTLSLSEANLISAFTESVLFGRLASALSSLLSTVNLLSRPLHRTLCISHIHPKQEMAKRSEHSRIYRGYRYVHSGHHCALIFLDQSLTLISD